MTKNFEIVYRNPAELIPYEMNAKKHDEQQIRDLAAAIKKRGFDQPITVDKHDVIITGHGRREAALLAGLERVPVIVRDDLSEEEVKAKRLEDNRLASIDYDAIKLQQELESLVLGDVEVFGFEERELNVLVGSMTEEMETGSLVLDLGEETERQKEEHTEISREVASEEVRVIDVLGFKTLPAGSAIVVGDLLAHMEEITGESGVDAFVAYAEKVSSGELPHEQIHHQRIVSDPREQNHAHAGDCRIVRSWPGRKRVDALRQSGAGSEAGRCGVHHRPIRFR